MLKEQELTDPESCLNKAREDEPIFVLLARDAAAAHAIRCWAMRRVEMRLNQASDLQIREALSWADRIDQFGPADQYGVCWRHSVKGCREPACVTG